MSSKVCDDNCKIISKNLKKYHQFSVLKEKLKGFLRNWQITKIYLENVEAIEITENTAALEMLSVPQLNK